jgi:hypothetical protein
MAHLAFGKLCFGPVHRQGPGGVLNLEKERGGSSPGRIDTVSYNCVIHAMVQVTTVNGTVRCFSSLQGAGLRDGQCHPVEAGSVRPTRHSRSDQHRRVYPTSSVSLQC